MLGQGCPSTALAFNMHASVVMPLLESPEVSAESKRWIAELVVRERKLIAGNFSEVTQGYVTEAASPVKTPHGGVILRLKPDASGAEIIADCFRNAYDFDFDAQGELFTETYETGRS